jgi:tetratricopeptide (TPR) repeat protein
MQRLSALSIALLISLPMVQVHARNEKKPPDKKNSSKTDKKQPKEVKPKKIPASELSLVPIRAAKSFETKAKQNRKKAEQLISRILKGLKEVGRWNIDPANKSQVKKSTKKLEGRSKQLKEAEKLYESAFGMERSSLKLKIKAAQVRELVDGEKTDVTAYEKRFGELSAGHPQAEIKSLTASIQLLIDALAQYIKGDLGEAIILTSKSIKTNDKLALAYVYQGSFLYLTQSRTKAVEAWKRALELDPDNKELRQALDKMVKASP